MRSRLSILATALFCFAAAASVRLYRIDDQIIQADERHWESRSQEFLSNIRKGNYSSATTHFSQPGLVPGVLMAGGQALVQSRNERSELSWGDDGYTDRLLASRMTNALSSALIPPVVFLGAKFFIGPAPAFLGAMFLALDPQLAAISRMAHIDAVLALLVTLSFLLFMRAEERSSLRLKLAAGAVWGLAIATKPTSAALVFALILYKFIRALGVFRGSAKKGPLLEWGDVLAVLSGHLVFCSIYTRFWRTNSPYVWRLHIDSKLADFFYAAGVELSKHAWWFLVTGWIALAGVHIVSSQLRREETRTAKFHLGLLFALIASLAFIWPMIPPVFENLTRYWTWAFGLSGEVHKAYGRTWDPPAFGYWGVIFKQLPSISLIGLGASLILLFAAPVRSDSGRAQRFVFACLLHAAVWALILGVSSKQTVRYIIPAWPTLHMAAAWGLVEAWRILAKRACFAEHLSTIALGGLLLLQTLLALSWAPHYELFHNLISGGLSRAVRAGDRMPPIGQNEAIEFLHERAKQKGADLYVMVLGDASVLQKTYRRSHPKDHKRLHFISYGPIANGDFVVVPPVYRSVLEEGDGRLLLPAYDYELFGQTFIKVMEVPHFDYTTPYTPDIGHTPRQTGELEILEDGQTRVIVGLPGRHRKGLMMYREHVRVNAGRYKVTLPVGPAPEAEFDPSLRPEEPAVKVELSRSCERAVYRRELPQNGFREISFFCEVDRPARLQYGIYWWAKTAVAIGAPTIVRE